MPGICYKLTDAKMQTHNGYQWSIGSRHTTNGTGDLCSRGWLHWYCDPLLAVLHNPIHGNYTPDMMRLFRAEWAGERKDDGQMKSGSTELRLVEELPVPVLTEAQRWAYAIGCAVSVYDQWRKYDKDGIWRDWARDWITGKNREAAWAAGAAGAARAAWAAGAAEAAWSAWAAEAAEAAGAAGADLPRIAREALIVGRYGDGRLA